MHVVLKVRKFVFIVVIISFFISSPAAFAEASTTKSNAALIERIAFLTAQVEKLQKQLAQLKSGTKRKSTAEFSYKTKFYTGSYEALYYTNGDRLSRQTNEGVRTGDQLLWNTFIDIAGESFAKKHISEFRIYNDPKSSVSAFVEEKPDNTWIIGFNRESQDIAKIHTTDPIVDLLIHEYAHIVFFNDEEIDDDFERAFWKGSGSASYSSNTFVSKYAAKSQDEDLAESFVEFVVSDKPTGTETKYKKVRFFYDYPEMVKLRTKLRQSDLI